MTAVRGVVIGAAAFEATEGRNRAPETDSTAGTRMGPMKAKPGKATTQLAPFAGLSRQYEYKKASRNSGEFLQNRPSFHQHIYSARDGRRRSRCAVQLLHRPANARRQQPRSPESYNTLVIVTDGGKAKRQGENTPWRVSSLALEHKRQLLVPGAGMWDWLAWHSRLFRSVCRELHLGISSSPAVRCHGYRGKRN